MQVYVTCEALRYRKKLHFEYQGTLVGISYKANAGPFASETRGELLVFKATELVTQRPAHFHRLPEYVFRLTLLSDDRVEWRDLETG